MSAAPAVSLDLTGRVAMVTGASRRRGIGAAICRALASHGADILCTHWPPFDRARCTSAGATSPTLPRVRVPPRLGVASALPLECSSHPIASRALRVPAGLHPGPGEAPAAHASREGDAMVAPHGRVRPAG